MECQRKNVQTICKWFYFMVMIIAIVAILFAVIQLVAFIWSVSGLSGEEMMIDGVYATLPDFLHIGDTNIFYRFGVYEMGGIGWRAVVGSFSAIITLLLALNVLRHLKNGEVPFSKIVVRSYKYFTTALCIFFFVNGTNVITFIVAGLIPCVIIFVFDYGRTLQEESDTTL